MSESIQTWPTGIFGTVMYCTKSEALIKIPYRLCRGCVYWTHPADEQHHPTCESA